MGRASELVFVSHSSRDATAAMQIVAALELAGVACWIAPRDIPAGTDYNDSIMNGINACTAMLLVYSRHSVASDPVKREVERCLNRKAPVVPVRLESVPPSPALEFMISTSQWVDAFPPPVDRHLDTMVGAVKRALSLTHDGPKRDVNAPPEYVGHYRIVEKLGEGGMGTVYKAEQRSPVKRTVAVKLIKQGMGTAEVLARFESERQALARMNHQHIAKVLDAGADDMGRPYFVMEYVPGDPITRFADKNKLTIKQRLELFMQVCQAITHAHTKQILHRDIKSGNVLAYMDDGKPTVKVIDFGIAKALTGDKLTDRTFNTDRGQVIGTYDSMSPEQADGSADIDTRTDVYSLGVLLYELLTGAKPFDEQMLRKAADAEVRRIIREVEPPRPSTRLSALKGEAGAQTAAARRGQIDTLTRELRSELEWIPLKAMRKERDRRYGTPLELAEDISNYLNDRPLRAGPESVSYRLKKAIRRNRRAVIASTIALLAMTVLVLAYIRGINIARDKTTQALALAREEERKTRVANVELDQQLYFRRITDAERELAIRDTPTAIKLLNACPPPLRGWEWNYLMRRVDGQDLTLTGHSSALWAASFSPDGLRVATVANDGLIKIWDSNFGTQIKSIFAEPTPLAPASFNSLVLNARGRYGVPIMCVAYSPDGRYIASGSFAAKITGIDFAHLDATIDTAASQGVVTLWDATTWEKAGEFREQLGVVLSVAFSPDGQLAASSSINPDHSLVVWTVRTQKVVKVLKGHQATVHCVRFSPDGKYIATSDSDGFLKLWDAKTLDEVNSIEAHKGPIIGIGFSPDSHQLATASQDSRISVWETNGLKKIRDLTGHLGSALAVTYSPDGTLIASGGYDRTVRVWDAQTGQERIALRGHDDTVWSVGFSPDGRRLLSAGFDKTATIWDIRPRAEAKPLGEFSAAYHTDRVNNIAFSPDGRMLASSGWDRSIKLVDTSTGALLRSLDGHRGATWGLAFSPDSRVIASASWDRTIRLWDTATGETIRSLTGVHTQPIHCVSFSPDGKRLASCGWDGKVVIWDPATGKPVVECKSFLFPVLAVAYAPDGTTLASCGGDRNPRVWDAKTGELVRVLKGHTAAVGGIAYSPDSHQIATAGWDRTIRIWDLSPARKTDDALLTIPAAHADRLSSIAYSHDGLVLASGSEDNTVRFWDPKTGKEIPSLPPLTHRGMVWSIAFSPSGNHLATGCWFTEASVRTWSFNPPR